MLTTESTSAVAVLRRRIAELEGMVARQAQELVAERQELGRLRRLCAQRTDAVVVHDLAGRIVDANEIALSRLGYRLAELQGRTIFELEVSLQGGEAAARRRWETATGALSGPTRGALITRDGTRIPVEMHVAVLAGESGRLVVVSARDVTERERAARALQDSEERLRRMFVAAPVGLMRADTAGQVLAANPALCAIVGEDEDALRRRRAWDLACPEDRVAVAGALRAVALGLQPEARVAVRLRGPAGPRPVAVSLLADGDERAPAVLAVVTAA